jgi:hypothetical protein
MLFQRVKLHGPLATAFKMDGTDDRSRSRARNPNPRGKYRGGQRRARAARSSTAEKARTFH